jgi:hypothetical protein
MVLHLFLVLVHKLNRLVKRLFAPAVIQLKPLSVHGAFLQKLFHVLQELPLLKEKSSAGRIIQCNVRPVLHFKMGFANRLLKKNVQQV